MFAAIFANRWPHKVGTPTEGEGVGHKLENWQGYTNQTF